MRSSRIPRVGLIPALLLTAALPASVFAKDAPETPLLREGRVYEAAQLLQKAAKDMAAQKRAADLYFQLALYEKAAERLIAAGMSKAAAMDGAVAEAFSQGNRAAALRVAEAGGTASSAKAEYVRRELAEGRAAAALALAREADDAALVAAAGRGAYEESVESGPVIVGYLSTSARRLRFSPDGRFILLWNDAKTEIEVLDTRLRPDRPANERGRFIDKGIAAGGFAMNSDGRFLAIVGLTKDKSGKEAISLRLERLDTGFVVRSLALSSRFPKGQASALAFAGDLLCVAIGRSLLLFDPLSGEVKTTATIEEGVSSIEYIERKKIFACWLPASGKYRAYDAASLQPSKTELSPAERPMERYGLGGAGLLVDEASGFRLYVPSSSSEDLRVDSLGDSSVSRSGAISRPFVDAKDLHYSGGIDAALSPDGRALAILAKEGVVIALFPFLDRADSAARLAKEFGLTDEFAPLCGYLVDEGQLDEAKRLWTIAGVDEKTIFRMFAESKLRIGSPIESAYDFIQAGEIDRALSVANGLIAAAGSGSDLAKAFVAGKAIYEKAGAADAPFALAAGRLAEKYGDNAAAVKYYAEAEARGDIERLAFDPNLASIDWCLMAGSLLGMSESEIYTRAVAVLEAQKEWSEAAAAYLWLRNDEGLGRVAKAALSGSDWDYKLLDVLKARADPGFCRAAAELLLGKGEFIYAVEQYAAVNDLAGVARVADKALDSDDFIFAAELYGSLGYKTARAATANRLKLVFEETSATIKSAEAYLAQETIDGVNAGRIAPLWPISASKAQDPFYQQMKRFGEALAALPSAPRSAEAKRCAAYLSKEAIKGRRGESSDSSDQQLSAAARFTFAARLLSAMGR
jgi:hypothetical protein